CAHEKQLDWLDTRNSWQPSKSGALSTQHKHNERLDTNYIKKSSKADYIVALKKLSNLFQRVAAPDIAEHWNHQSNRLTANIRCQPPQYAVHGSQWKHGHRLHSIFHWQPGLFENANSAAKQAVRRASSHHGQSLQALSVRHDRHRNHVSEGLQPLRGQASTFKHVLQAVPLLLHMRQAGTTTSCTATTATCSTPIACSIPTASS
ncbi:unnamed protein product, partial [Closterium sp. Naga37s-1]